MDDSLQDQMGDRLSGDTALALEPTENREFFLNRLRMDVDALSHSYSRLRGYNDWWNQMIMVISSLGALVTSVLTIAERTGWPYEVVPIVIQTSSGILAAWMRFYDFPKRMEAIINAKHATNDVRERLQKSAIVDDALWEQYCNAVKNLDSVLTPEERDASHVLALKFMKRERVREAQLHGLLGMSNIDLIRGKKLKHLGIGHRATSDPHSDTEQPSVRQTSPVVQFSDRGRSEEESSDETIERPREHPIVVQNVSAHVEAGAAADPSLIHPDITRVTNLSPLAQRPDDSEAELTRLGVIDEENEVKPE